MEYYADSRAPDEGAGTFKEPWRSIAANVNKLKPGDTLFLRGDVEQKVPYVEPSIVIEASGAADAPILVVPYQNERVVLQELSGYAPILDVLGKFIQVGGIDPAQLEIDRAGMVAPAVRFKGERCALMDAEVRNGYGARWGVLIKGANNAVIGCDVHDFFHTETTDALAVAIDDGPGHVVERCRIWDNAGNCIYTNDKNWPTGWRIEGCELWSTITPCSEQGIDAKGNADERAYIRGNKFHGFRACNSTCGGSGTPFGDAILVHNSADLVTVEYNEVWDCSAGIRVDDMVSGVVVRRNVVRDLVTSEDDPHAGTMSALFLRGAGTEVYHNTVIGSPEHSLVLHPDGSGAVRNNIFAHCGRVYDAGVDGFEFGPNCWWECEEVVEAEGDVLKDPRFVDYWGDYHLGKGSPCIWAGMDLGEERPDPSLGAFEYEEEEDGGMAIVDDLRAIRGQMQESAEALGAVIAALEAGDEEIDALRDALAGLLQRAASVAGLLEEDAPGEG